MLQPADFQFASELCTNQWYFDIPIIASDSLFSLVTCTKMTIACDKLHSVRHAIVILVYGIKLGTLIQSCSTNHNCYWLDVPLDYIRQIDNRMRQAFADSYIFIPGNFNLEQSVLFWTKSFRSKSRWLLDIINLITNFKRKINRYFSNSILV